MSQNLPANKQPAFLVSDNSNQQPQINQKTGQINQKTAYNQGPTLKTLKQVEDILSLKDSQFEQLLKLQQRLVALSKSQRYKEIYLVLDDLEEKIFEYFRNSTKSIRDLSKIKAINKERKRLELMILQNKASIYRSTDNYDECFNYLLIIIHQVHSIIDANRVRIGFLCEQEEQDRTEKKKIHSNIVSSKIILIKTYYAFAVLAFEQHQFQNCLACSQKILLLIQDIYLFLLHSQNTKSIETQNAHQIKRIQTLLLILQLNDEISFSTNLRQIQLAKLLQIINHILSLTSKTHINTNTLKHSVLEFQPFNLKEIHEIISNNQSNSKSSQSNNNDTFTEQFDLKLLASICFLTLVLLGNLHFKTKIQIQTNNEEIKLKYTKNQIFEHILALIVFQKCLISFDALYQSTITQFQTLVLQYKLEQYQNSEKQYQIVQEDEKQKEFQLDEHFIRMFINKQRIQLMKKQQGKSHQQAESSGDFLYQRYLTQKEESNQREQRSILKKQKYVKHYLTEKQLPFHHQILIQEKNTNQIKKQSHKNQSQEKKKRSKKLRQVDRFARVLENYSKQKQKDKCVKTIKSERFLSKQTNKEKKALITPSKKK